MYELSLVYINKEVYVYVEVGPSGTEHNVHEATKPCKGDHKELNID